jgi:putative spermidine/putrescine transport system permease protein
MEERRGIDLLSIIFGIFLVGVALFIMAPLIFVIFNAFNSAAYNVFPPEGFSLKWFGVVLRYPTFRPAFINSVIVGLGAMVISVVLGTMAARAFVKYRFKFDNLTRSLLYAPALVPNIAIGAGIFLYYIRIGLYGGRFGLILAHSLLGLPFVISIMAAVMLSLDPALEEAAQDLGAKPLETFLRVTLPQMQAGLIVAAMFAFIISFDELETSLFLVRPANNTLPIEMFLYLQEYQNPSLAALSTLIIAITALAVIILIPFVRKQVERRKLLR